jgi:hypothetical protein
MAYSEVLVERMRSALAGRMDVAERKMFGGLCFMVSGHMACGTHGEEIMVRVGPDAHAQALQQPHARPMDFTGRPMKGFVFVGTEGIASDEDLADWIAYGVAFATSMPPK